MRKFLFSFLFIAFSNLSFGQETKNPINNYQEDLSFYSDALVNCTKDENRERAHQKFYHLLKESLEENNSYELDLSFLDAVSVQLAEDSSFRIISWQLFKSEGEYQYYCFLQKQDGRLYEWKDQAKPIADLEYEILNQDYWYGALYYKLEKVDTIESPYYLLYGFSQEDQYTRQKVLDVLYFENDEPILGKGVFYKERGDARPDVKNRLVLQYSADVGITLNYNPEMQMVIFDHLIPQRGRMPGQGMTLYPDGSYEGFALKGDKWVYKEKIFDTVLDEAPRPKPVLGDKKKGLFGQDKK